MSLSWSKVVNGKTYSSDDERWFDHSLDIEKCRLTYLETHYDFNLPKSAYQLYIGHVLSSREEKSSYCLSYKIPDKLENFVVLRTDNLFIVSMATKSTPRSFSVEGYDLITFKIDIPTGTFTFEFE